MPNRIPTEKPPARPKQGAATLLEFRTRHRKIKEPIHEN
jgi:hypothetical protein